MCVCVSYTSQYALEHGLQSYEEPRQGEPTTPMGMRGLVTTIEAY